MADGGAEILKLEPPDGDALRRWAIGAEVGPDEDGALFQFLACSKKSVVIDPADPAGLQKAGALVGGADAVVWSPGTPLADALDPHVLRERAPAVPVVSITPFGLEGPWADRAWTELTLQ